MAMFMTFFDIRMGYVHSQASESNLHLGIPDRWSPRVACKCSDKHRYEAYEV
jgi:hypothetical protein